MPNGKAGNIRHGIDGAGLCGAVVHLVGTDIRHPVGTIVNGHRFRGQPSVSLDESHAVGSPAAQPVGTDKIFVAADTVRILFQLVGKERFGQHIAIGPPDIAPARFPCVDGVGHKVSSIFAVGVGES